MKSPVRAAIRRSCAICDLTFPNERLLQSHAAQHAPGEIEIVDTESELLSYIYISMRSILVCSTVTV